MTAAHPCLPMFFQGRVPPRTHCARPQSNSGGSRPQVARVRSPRPRFGGLDHPTPRPTPHPTPTSSQPLSNASRNSSRDASTQGAAPPSQGDPQPQEEEAPRLLGTGTMMEGHAQAEDELQVRLFGPGFGSVRRSCACAPADRPRQHIHPASPPIHHRHPSTNPYHTIHTNSSSPSLSPPSPAACPPPRPRPGPRPRQHRRPATPSP